MAPQPLVRRLPWHPPLLVAAFITFNLVDSGVHVASTGRAFLVGMGGAVALQLALSAVLRSHHRGAAVATAIIAVVIFWVPITVVASGFARLPTAQAWFLGVLGTALVGYVCWLSARRLTRRSGPALTRALNVVAVALAGVVVLSLATSPLAPRLVDDIGIRAGETSAARAAAAAPDQPDFYVIVADGHPRADALAEWTGHDLSTFESRLRQRGFAISTDARANYSWTSATLITLFNMELLDELPRVNALETRIAINGGEAFNLLRERGYETVVIGPPFEHAAVRDADTFIDGGYLNSFECHLIRRTAVGSLAWAISPSIVGDFRRDGVRRSLDVATEFAASQRASPRFVLVHLPVPHLPVLWGPDGMAVDDPRGSDCAPQGIRGMDRQDLMEAYLATVDHLDQMLVAAVADIQDRSAIEPAIVILSDHGAHFGGEVPNRADAQAWRDEFGILFAASTPGHGDLFPNDVSLANVLPRLFNAYFGTDLEINADRSFWPDGSEALEPQRSE